MSVIVNLPWPIEIVIAQVDDHVRYILRVLQKLLKYFNGTIILKSFVLPQARVFHAILL